MVRSGVRSGRGVVARRCLGVAAIAILGLGGCGSDPIPPEIDDEPDPVTSFSFLLGSWTVTTRDADGAGGYVESTGSSVVSSSYSGRAIKETWVGVRDGEAAEMRSLVVASDAPPAWIVAHADGASGTFDILEGRFVSSRAEMFSRADTRPDGGLTRETFESITDSSFVRRTAHSDDGGASWTESRVAEYARVAPMGSLAGPAVSAACQTPEHRQFDFWEGNWAVGGATNDLPSLLGGCILEENWSSSTERGTSFNMYDPRSGLWNQVWVDTNGVTIVTHGGLDGGSMVLSGRLGGSMQRITWTPIDDNVRQLGEASLDGGSTWSTSYDITYTPR